MSPSSFDETLRRIREAGVPVFFVGSHKNSGKTTTFMRVAQCLQEQGVPTVLASLGRDGEAQDAFFGHEKPLVRLVPGMHFVTVLPPQAAAAVRLVAPLPGFVDGRQLGLFEALSCGEIELWGPPAAAELRRVLDALFALPPRNAVQLVDGALDRQAALYQGPCAMVLCAKPASPNVAAFTQYLQARRALLEAKPAPPGEYPRIPGGEFPPGQAKSVQVDGPLTTGLAKSLLAAEVENIIVESPMHVFCEPPLVLRLANRLRVRTRPLWLATSIHPAAEASIAPEILLKHAQDALGPQHPVFDPLAA